MSIHDILDSTFDSIIQYSKCQYMDENDSRGIYIDADISI